MQIFNKVIQAFKKIPPNVVGTPINRNAYITEMAEEPMFVSHKIHDYKIISYELYKIIEDIEKSEVVTTGDDIGLRSLVKELAEKRFIYLNNADLEKLKKDVSDIIADHNKMDNKDI